MVEEKVLIRFKPNLNEPEHFVPKKSLSDAELYAMAAKSFSNSQALQAMLHRVVYLRNNNRSSDALEATYKAFTVTLQEIQRLTVEAHNHGGYQPALRITTLVGKMEILRSHFIIWLKAIHGIPS